MSKRIETEMWSVDELLPYDKNVKKHDPAQIDKLAKLIETQGFTQPIIAVGDEPRGQIIAGHGRRLALLKLNYKKKIPVRVIYGHTPAEIDAMRLSDNRISSTDYDTTLMQEELFRLSDEGIDLMDLGFSEKEVEFMSADLGEFDESAFVENITEAVEHQVENNREAVAETDAGVMPIGDALGVKRVTIAQSRVLRRFIADIEAKTGKSGVDALIDFAEKGEWR